MWTPLPVNLPAMRLPGFLSICIRLVGERHHGPAHSGRHRIWQTRSSTISMRSWKQKPVSPCLPLASIRDWGSSMPKEEPRFICLRCHGSDPTERRCIRTGITAKSTVRNRRLFSSVVTVDATSHPDACGKRATVGSGTRVDCRRDCTGIDACRCTAAIQRSEPQIANPTHTIEPQRRSCEGETE